MVDSLRIAVVGAGAIGSFYGGKLAVGGRDVHFLVRGGFDRIKRSGIRIRGRRENFHIADAQVYQTPREIGPCDLVLITLKATNNDAMLELIPPLLHRRTILLTLQNGLGNEEFLAQHFGAERVMGGLCFICLNRISPGLIEHLDHGHLNLGELVGVAKERTHNLARQFSQCGVECRVVENLMEEHWHKLVWNIPFNGLTVAAGGITTANILRSHSLRSEAIALMNEVVVGAKSCGFSLPMDVVVEQIKRTETMGAYKPSTLLDFEAGRALEIEAIWGEPLRRAQANGATMPRLEELYQRLKTLDARRE
ncbi:MAG: 2-dehydropantoate 2-reductase [Verrucomicrobia bacterium]|nr:MAG: 2-dehydropantoate 2-reductase [Verrucomicrobiota bacterium]